MLPLCLKSATSGSRSAHSTTSAVQEISVACNGGLLIRPNDMGTGSDPDIPPQVTVKALGYFGET
jgi:hypothetical protein